MFLFLCLQLPKHSIPYRRNSREELSDGENYDRRGDYSKETSSSGRPRMVSRNSRPHSSDEENSYDNRRSSSQQRSDRSLERDNYRITSQRDLDESRLYDLEADNSPEKQTNVRMISRSRPSLNGRATTGGSSRPGGAFVPKDVRSSGGLPSGRGSSRNDDDYYDDRRRGRGDSYDHQNGGNYDDFPPSGGNSGRHRDYRDIENNRREDSFRERDMRDSRDNNRENRSTNRRDNDYFDERERKPQPSRQNFEPSKQVPRGRDVALDFDDEPEDGPRKSAHPSGRDLSSRASYREAEHEEIGRRRDDSTGRNRGEASYPDRYSSRSNQPPSQDRRHNTEREEFQSDPRLNQSLRAAHGSWTAQVDTVSGERNRKEGGGSDFEIISDHDDNRDRGSEEDSIEEIPSNSHGHSSRGTGRNHQTKEPQPIKGEDDDYRAPAGSFGHFISKQEEQGITLPRKSGRYDDTPEGRESSSGRVTTNVNASGSWMTGGPPLKVSTPPPTASHLAPATFSHTSRNSFVLVAHPRGMRTQHVQCTILRDRTSMHGKLYPTYELVLEEPRKTFIIAPKMSLNRTSNYHLFDMTRGQAGSKLSKKAGNYLGKLRARNVNRTGYALLNHKSDREEIGGVLFDRVTMIDQIKEGNQPRRMTVLIPPIDDDGLSVPSPLNSLGVESLTDLLQAVEENKRVIPDHFSLMHTKDPVFENGNYRLNFHGRVSMPSVKNFQMVSDDDIEDIKCQFGKVDKDVFHLDYKAPFNAVQAFALALCQFNL